MNFLRRSLKRLLPWSVRKRIRYTAKMPLLWGFRRTIDALRILHVLPSRAAPDSPMHLLIVNLTPYLGDTVMQIPMIEALRAANPGARIDYAVEESAAPLLRMMSELDNVYALRLGRIPPVGLRPAMSRGLLVVREYWKHMRSCAPTVCLLPRWGDDLFRSMVLAYLTGAPRRIGFSWSVVADARPAPYRDAFLTDICHGGRGQHEPIRFCHLANHAGLIPHAFLDRFSTGVVPSLQRIAATPDWEQLAERLCVRADAPFAVIAPGASQPKRLWPLERWADVMAELRTRGLHVVLLSGPSDADLAHDLQKRSGGWASLAAGQTTLIESLALLARAKLFIGNDSGPGHMAGSLGIPTVVLFVATTEASPDDPNSSVRIRPVGPNVAECLPARNLEPCQGACRAESAHCIRVIEVRDVLKAVDDLLDQRDAAATV